MWRVTLLPILFVLAPGCAGAPCSVRPFAYDVCGKELHRLPDPEREVLIRELVARDRALCLDDTAGALHDRESAGRTGDIVGRERACMHAAIELMGLQRPMWGRREHSHRQQPDEREFEEGLALLETVFHRSRTAGASRSSAEADVRALALGLLRASARLGIYSSAAIPELENAFAQACASRRTRLGESDEAQLSLHAVSICNAEELWQMASWFPASIRARPSVQARLESARAETRAREAAEQAARQRAFEESFAPARKELDPFVANPDPLIGMSGLLAHFQANRAPSHPAYHRAAYDLVMAHSDPTNPEQLREVLARARDDSPVSEGAMSASRELRARHQAALAETGPWTLARAAHLGVLLTLRVDDYGRKKAKVGARSLGLEAREIEEKRAEFVRASVVVPSTAASGTCAELSHKTDLMHSPFGPTIDIEASCTSAPFKTKRKQLHQVCGGGGATSVTSPPKTRTFGGGPGCIRNLNGECEVASVVETPRPVTGSGGGGGCREELREVTVSRVQVEVRGVVGVTIGDVRFTEDVVMKIVEDERAEAFAEASWAVRSRLLKRSDVLGAARAWAERRRDAASSPAERLHWTYALAMLANLG